MIAASALIYIATVILLVIILGNIAIESSTTILPKQWFLLGLPSVYILLGIGIYFAYLKTQNILILVLFSLQMFLNLVWIFSFFRYQRRERALLILLISVIILLYTISRLIQTHLLLVFFMFPFALWLLLAVIKLLSA
jgi:tryptophan-rich sensory protein